MLDKILEVGVNKNASDIHLVYNEPPIYRIKLKLFKSNLEILSEDGLKEVVIKIIGNDRYKRYYKAKHMDYAFTYKNMRIRAHIFKQNRKDNIVLRLIPLNIPNFEDLNLPSNINKVLDYNKGLILVVGPTGSGKSTTLASIINKINKTYNKHIITLEDPIEYLYSNEKSIVSQRELNVDFYSFKDGIKSALRSDPDIILVGELRDKDSIKYILELAETGHLVFSTLHTDSVVGTMQRIINIFDDIDKKEIRYRLSENIKSIISQKLVLIDDYIRPICEIMYINNAIKNIIFKGDNLSMIEDQIMMNTSNGMLPFKNI